MRLFIKKKKKPRDVLNGSNQFNGIFNPITFCGTNLSELKYIYIYIPEFNINPAKNDRLCIQKSIFIRKRKMKGNKRMWRVKFLQENDLSNSDIERKIC
jgi:hypothetical protein